MALGWLGWGLPRALLPARRCTGPQGRGGHRWGFAEPFRGSLQGKITSPLSLPAFVLAQSHAMTQWQGWEESPGLPTLLGNASDGWSWRCSGIAVTFSPPCPLSPLLEPPRALPSSLPGEAQRPREPASTPSSNPSSLLASPLLPCALAVLGGGALGYSRGTAAVAMGSSVLGGASSHRESGLRLGRGIKEKRCLFSATKPGLGRELLSPERC